ncbi:MAG: hypothetical protein QG625_1378 [Cyanobacteriota bacterium erpe_2018_sw_39hr_WHONDRS-SW48-000098_B_bin.30]|jgi:hypothetical protein|nr:hypothetical protein [Candidatus Obscuribacter sp.]MBK9201111.1 hypothetical protein [Candidatus Obscuribacter sp.]MBK9621776.1 hypothetical protein [Candidatus Obscuribacter sp.]MDQ5965223.1 hypothetical protein [Cyanobacteriota bacterium erpe_2018_sw_39hr_WHONDRS-SW48-000098_B_bin.30]
MIFAKKIFSWDTLADSIIAACWRTDKRYVTRQTRTMLKALRSGVASKNLDRKLLENLTRLAQFCCLEGNYAKAARIYETVLKAQERVLCEDDNAYANTRMELDTITRIRDEKHNWAQSRAANSPKVATDSLQTELDEHIYFLSNQAA